MVKQKITSIRLDADMERRIARHAARDPRFRNASKLMRYLLRIGLDAYETRNREAFLALAEEAQAEASA